MAGSTQQFTAQGTFSNGATRDLTALVTWTSSTPSVASIAAGGLATTSTAGSSTISASFNQPAGMVTGSTTLTVAGIIDNLANGGARPFFGWVSDQIGREYTMAIAFTAGGLAYWLLGSAGTTPWTFVICAALAAVAGLLFMVYYGVVNFADGFVPGVKAFTAAVLGGVGNIPGAMLGGLVIGLLETLGAAYISGEWKDAIAFIILITVIVVRPTGLLGRKLNIGE